MGLLLGFQNSPFLFVFEAGEGGFVFLAIFRADL